MQIDTKLMEQVKSVLQQFGTKYMTEDGALKRNTVINDLDKYDKDLMAALLANNLIKDEYTEQIADTTVFKLNHFIDMFEYQEFWGNSFTKYANRIGLTSNNKFIEDSSDIVLDFPYKDTILKAGMSDEDSETDELFLNETLASSEISELLEPKIFINAKKYDANGEHNATTFRNSDNLIIKGNNLIALHSMANQYKESAKLIYLDPPYNTKSAANTFLYNNRYNHSSWLTFMKNRLEISKKLVSEDGFIVAAIDSNELFYLGVLMDEIFGVENRLSVLAVVHNPGGRQDEEFFPTAHENLIVFAKNRELAKLNNLPISDEKKKQYKLKDKYGRYKLRGFRRSGNNSLRTQRPKLFYPIYVNNDTHTLSLHNDGNSTKLLPIDKSGTERCWRWGSNTFNEKKDKYIEVKKKGDTYELYVKERESDYEGEKAKSLWAKPEYTGQNATQTLKRLFDEKVFTYPKSEFVMRDLIQVCTNPHDLVIDFFMGSATTQAAAMKMHRRFVGIEQMNYINTISVPRLQKVIAGEQGGISKDVDWQGGGSFIYVELMEKNQGFLHDLQKASTIDELNTVYTRMKQGADLDFRADLDKYENDPERTSLSFEEQKKLLIKLLDKNQLYYNEANIDDTNVRDLISDSDYQFNKSFYNGKESE